MHWLYLIIAIACEVAATSALKSAEEFTRLIPSLIVILGYGASFFFLSLTLKAIPIGITYAIWSGIGVIFISIIGYYFFKQHLDTPAIIGISLIVAGVVIINLFSKSVAH